MPVYKFLDEDSGVTFSVEADSQPTEDEAMRFLPQALADAGSKKLGIGSVIGRMVEQEVAPLRNEALYTFGQQAASPLSQAIAGKSPEDVEREKYSALGLRIPSLKPAAKKAEDAWKAPDEQPSVNLPKIPIAEDAAFSDAVARTVINAGISLPEFFTSKAGLATIAAGAVAPVPTALFWTSKLFKIRWTKRNRRIPTGQRCLLLRKEKLLVQA